MIKNPLRILITGAGAPGIRGTLFCLKNNEDKIPIVSVGVDIRDDAVGKYFLDRFYKVPAPENAEYADSILDICRKEKIDVIVPQTTREIAVLSKKRDEFLTSGYPVMVSSHETICRSNDKADLIKVFEKEGLPVPNYKVVTSKDELMRAVRDLEYPSKPVVIKPAVSFGMRGLRILRSKPWNFENYINEKPVGVDISLDHFLEIMDEAPRWPKFLVTEYLPGAEYTVDVLIGSKNCTAVPRLRKSIRSGISFENILEPRDDLARYALQASSALKLQYAVGFQFKLDKDGVPRILECNPRVQGTMVASYFGGVNIIWLAVKDLLGYETHPSKCVLKNASFYRYWGGIGISGDKIYEI